MAVRKKLPPVDSDVIVTWLDSGIGVHGEPSKSHVKLEYKTTHGKLSQIIEDKLIHIALCTKSRCVCKVLELTMCSAGKDDCRSDLAGIWWEAVTEIKVVK